MQIATPFGYTSHVQSVIISSTSSLTEIPRSNFGTDFITGYEDCLLCLMRLYVNIGPIYIQGVDGVTKHFFGGIYMHIRVCVCVCVCVGGGLVWGYSNIT